MFIVTVPGMSDTAVLRVRREGCPSSSLRAPLASLSLLLPTLWLPPHMSCFSLPLDPLALPFVADSLLQEVFS